MAEYSLIPQDVSPVQTKYRTIKTQLPVPESLPIFESLKVSEPRSMMGQPPVIWHKAEGSVVSDPWGNRWIDWSSCVLVSNIGHGREEIKDALRGIIDQGLLSSYVFVHEKRAELAEMLRSISPDPAGYRSFILSTGSEATENCIKLCKTYAFEKYGLTKKYFVTFKNAFHGRTMGSQLAGGMDRQKTGMVDRDRTFIQVPFPDGFKNEDTSFDLFLSSLADQNVKPEEIAGVMAESYQGVGPDFLPVEYARKMQEFCTKHDIVMCFDEVQSGFGRTGKMFCFQHYGVKPDLIACGKGISSSLPLSAVIGRSDIMDIYAPGSMTSTHSGSPLPVAAAVANLKVLIGENLSDRAAEMGKILLPELQRIRDKYPDRLGVMHGMGLVAGIQCVKPGTKTPSPASRGTQWSCERADPDTALAINVACMHRGLLMFSPVGIAGECVKIAPPLSIPEDALRESIQVFEDAVRFSSGRRVEVERKPWRLSNITLKDVMDTEGGFRMAVLPFGSTEPHNYHLPYGTDTHTVTAIADLACAKAWDAGAKVVLLPPVTAGSNVELIKFPMTIHWSSLTYESIIRDVTMSLKVHGVHKLVIANGHGGNQFQHIMQELVTDREMFIIHANWWQFAPKALEENSEKPGGHAHEWETSVAMHLFPELVKFEWATAGETNESSLSAINEGKVHLAYPWHLFTNNSGCGDPSLATPEKGRRITEAVVEEFSKFLVEFNNAEITDRFPY